MRSLDGLKVSQFVADLAEGDAISMDCMEIERILARWGCRTQIYADRQHPRAPAKALPPQRHHLDENEVAILHYSLWSDSAEYLLKLRHPRLVMIYHNVTPAEYFRSLNPQAEQATTVGRKALARFAPVTSLALGDSEFNRQELEACGFRRTGVLPIAVDFERLNGRPNFGLLKELGDGYVNLLSVGRIVPNKHLEDVIKLFYHYKRQVNPRSRLFLVGPADMGIPYLHWLQSLVEYLGLDPHVYFPGRVTMPDLLAYYRSAKAYICLSEHEGFCVPLVESMHLGAPVLAYASSAVPETLGNGGVLFHRKDYAPMSEILRLLVEAGPFRERMVAAGRERASAFSREQVASTLRRHLEAVV
ncbi:MAG: glycosyltransferase [Dehalococcoidia bacterium]|nr:glycosyltransferase [Dehalococcoidia bacterium]